MLLSNAANNDKDGVVLVDAMESLHPSVKIGRLCMVTVCYILFLSVCVCVCVYGNLCVCVCVVCVCVCCVCVYGNLCVCVCVVCVCAGERLEVEVVTELSSDGEFWCQLLLSSEERDYEALQEQLQAGREGEREAFTPVFYHEGEICVAQFSEDENWYRARIERVYPGMVRNENHTHYTDCVLNS